VTIPREAVEAVAAAIAKSDEDRARKLWRDIGSSATPGFAVISFDEFKAALDYVAVVVRAEEHETRAKEG
jgi:hypothetical protein